MEFLSTLIDLFLHLDKHLGEIIQQYGAWTYLILALVIFCETGLVVTPFLPGDSLLFATGAFAGLGYLDIKVLLVVLTAMAILGDAVNYSIGKKLGRGAFERYPRLFKKEYLEETQRFYEKYGPKTIVIARFVPIVRTFAPFLAGVGSMSYSRFALYNVSGALLWVLSITLAGYFFGELPIVKNNFSLVVLGIIVLSIMPAVIEIFRARRAARAQ